MTEQAAPTNPSSPAEAPSPSAPAAPAAASAPTPSPAPAAAERPDYVPETHWDTEKGSPKPEFGQFVKDHVAFKAAEDSRRLTLPKAAEEYKLALPKTFQPPEGVEFKLDENDPMFAQARTWAHKNGLSQEAFEAGLEMIAARDVGTQQMLKNARDAEIAKLGANGSARVTALNTWLDSKGYPSLKGMLVTETIIKDFEKLMRDAQGGSNFSQQHREQGEEPGKIPGIEKMNFKQAREAQDRAAAAAKRH